uniref:Uncharacterized protein n=1 Tax=Sphaerodactylus townsendi TaxID=933632 RepID=A0ACB8E7M2_9SAUR
MNGKHSSVGCPVYVVLSMLLLHLIEPMMLMLKEAEYITPHMINASIYYQSLLASFLYGPRRNPGSGTLTAKLQAFDFTVHILIPLTVIFFPEWALLLKAALQEKEFRWQIRNVRERSTKLQVSAVQTAQKNANSECSREDQISRR